MNQIAQYFDELADRWDAELCHKSPVQGAVARLAGIQEGSRVLDLGCGTGVMADVYLSIDDVEVVALDLAPQMIKLAKHRYHDEEQLRFLCCDAYEYTDTELFDAVVIYNAYPHFADKPALARKVHSLLKPQGRFVVAHGMGKDALNAHHAGMSEELTSDLRDAKTEALDWEACFAIDAIVDTPLFYCFGGTKR